MVFQKQEQVWNPVLNRIDKLDPEYGFYRLYNYNFSLQASTIIYGRYEAKKKTRKVQAIRHTITPTVSFSYAPDFSKQKYGYVKTVQSDTLGNFKTYSPFEGSIFGVPSSGQSMAINASLSQTLEMKVLSKRDTSGMKKIKLIDELRIGQVSYNFLADSMGLSNIPISLRTTVFQNFGININATLDPYRVTPQGQRINKLFFPGRVVSASTSFGYTFQSRQDNSTPAINDINSAPIDPAYANPFYDPYGQMNPALRRQYMTQAYYDFSLPWNLGFNYTISYSSSPTNNGTTGYQKTSPRPSVSTAASRFSQNGRDIPGWLRLPGQRAYSGLHHHYTRPALLADVVRMDSLRSLPELELQHRGQSRLPCRPEVRQEPEHVRQFILNFGRFRA